MSAKNKLKVSQIEKVVDHIIKNNNYLESYGKKKNTLAIESAAGIGKTSIVQQIAEKNDLHFVKLNLSNLEEVGDLVGFPIREFQSKDGEWYNEKHLENSKKDMDLTGLTRTSYCPPHWLPRDAGDKGGILLLDDYSRADARFIQACMEITDKQEYISWALPKGWNIILTTNPDDGNYFVTPMDNAQKTRFIKLEMEFNIEDWGKWAELEGIDSRCINFLLLNPEMINDKADDPVNARLATDFFSSISSLSSFEAHFDLIENLGSGSVGEEFTQTFIMFINNKLDKMPDPNWILNHNSEDDVFQAMRSVFGKVETATYRTNVASVMATRLLNVTGKMILEKSYDKKYTQRLINIMKEDIFSKDINYNLYKTLNGNNNIKGLTDDMDLVRKVG